MKRSRSGSGDSEPSSICCSHNAAATVAWRLHCAFVSGDTVSSAVHSSEFHTAGDLTELYRLKAARKPLCPTVAQQRRQRRRHPAIKRMRGNQNLAASPHLRCSPVKEEPAALRNRASCRHHIVTANFFLARWQLTSRFSL